MSLVQGLLTLVVPLQPVLKVLWGVKVREAACNPSNCAALSLRKEPPVSPPCALQHPTSSTTRMHVTKSVERDA